MPLPRALARRHARWVLFGVALVGMGCPSVGELGRGTGCMPSVADCDTAEIRAGADAIEARRAAWSPSEGVVFHEPSAVASTIWKACSGKPRPVERYLDALTRHPETPSELGGRPSPVELVDTLAEELPGHLRVHGGGLEVPDSFFAFWTEWVDTACPGIPQRGAGVGWNTVEARTWVFDTCGLERALPDQKDRFIHTHTHNAGRTVQVAALIRWLADSGAEQSEADRLLVPAMRGIAFGLWEPIDGLRSDVLLPAVGSGVPPAPVFNSWNSWPAAYIRPNGALSVGAHRVVAVLKDGAPDSEIVSDGVIVPLLDALEDELESLRRIAPQAKPGPALLAVHRDIPFATVALAAATARAAGYAGAQLLVLGPDVDQPLRLFTVLLSEDAVGIANRATTQEALTALSK